MYNSKYTGAEIEAAIDKVKNNDITTEIVFYAGILDDDITTQLQSYNSSIEAKNIYYSTKLCCFVGVVVQPSTGGGEISTPVVSEDISSSSYPKYYTNWVGSENYNVPTEDGVTLAKRSFFALNGITPNEKTKINNALTNDSLKTINGHSLIGLGDIVISGGDTGGSLSHTATDDTSYSVVVLDPTKTFASQITAENTVYVIQDEFDLGGQVVWMKNNTTLWFYGGMLKNGCIKTYSISGNKPIYHTAIYTSAKKVCFKDVVIFGYIESYGYDWMFEDTQREDDYLMLHNLFHFEHGEIVDKKTLNITTWLNPYCDTYQLTTSKASKGILTHAGFNLNGNGAIVNILMDDEEKFEQCPKVDYYTGTFDSDGDYYVYARGLSHPFIRFNMNFPSSIINSDMTIRNITFIDNNTINTKGADPSKFKFQVKHPVADKYVTVGDHSGFIVRSGQQLGNMTAENVNYNGRAQFVGMNGGVENDDVPLPNFVLKNCDIFVFGYFICELFTIGRHADGTGYKAFDTFYAYNCRLKNYTTTTSNSTVKNREVYSNCEIIGMGSIAECAKGEVFEIDNCIFREGAWAVNGNEYKCDYNINNCTFECHNLYDARAEESGFNRKPFNGRGTTRYNNCTFITDYESNKDTRLKIMINEYGATDSKLIMNDCDIHLPDSESFTQGLLFSGQVEIHNCKIVSDNGISYPFIKAKKMMVNVTEDSDFEGLKRNPRYFDKANENLSFGKFALGWSYLKANSNMAVVNDEVMFSDNQSIGLVNSDLQFFGRVMSITLLLDFPLVGFTISQVNEFAFIFSFNIDNYTVRVQNYLTNTALEMSVTNNTNNTSYKMGVNIQQGLHNYTFTLTDDDKNPILFVDDKRTTKSVLSSYTDYHSLTDFNGGLVSNAKLTVSKCCGVKQIIIKPFATL